MPDSPDNPDKPVDTVASRRNFLKTLGIGAVGLAAGAGINETVHRLTAPRTIELGGKTYTLITLAEYNREVARASAEMAENKNIIDEALVRKKFFLDELVTADDHVGKAPLTLQDKAVLRMHPDIAARMKPTSEEGALSIVASAYAARKRTATRLRWENLVENAKDVFLETKEGQEYQELLKTHPKAALKQLLSALHPITDNDTMIPSSKLRQDMEELLGKAEDNATMAGLLKEKKEVGRMSQNRGLNAGTKWDVDQFLAELVGQSYMNERTLHSLNEIITTKMQNPGIIDTVFEHNKSARAEVMKYLWDEAVTPGIHDKNRRNTINQAQMGRGF